MARGALPLKDASALECHIARVAWWQAGQGRVRLQDGMGQVVRGRWVEAARVWGGGRRLDVEIDLELGHGLLALLHVHHVDPEVREVRAQPGVLHHVVLVRCVAASADRHRTPRQLRASYPASIFDPPQHRRVETHEAQQRGKAVRRGTAEGQQRGKAVTHSLASLPCLSAVPRETQQTQDPGLGFMLGS